MNEENKKLQRESNSWTSGWQADFVPMSYEVPHNTVFDREQRSKVLKEALLFLLFLLLLLAWNQVRKM